MKTVLDRLLLYGASICLKQIKKRRIFPKNTTPFGKNFYHLIYDSCVGFCTENKLGDPFYSSHAREILCANTLGHDVSINYYQEDATDSEGVKYEYKSTTTNRYSFAFHYFKPKSYCLQGIHNKLTETKSHIFSKYDSQTLELESVYKVSSLDVWSLLNDQAEKKWEKKEQPLKNSRVTKARNRLLLDINQVDIEKIGTPIYKKQERI